MAKARVMAPKESRPALKASDIQVGKFYRGKNPKTIRGAVNDREVVSLSPNGKEVQYDSTAIKPGRVLPIISMDAFLKWASHEIF